MGIVDRPFTRLQRETASNSIQSFVLESNPRSDHSAAMVALVAQSDALSSPLSRSRRCASRRRCGTISPDFTRWSNPATIRFPSSRHQSVRPCPRLTKSTAHGRDSANRGRQRHERLTRRRVVLSRPSRISSHSLGRGTGLNSVFKEFAKIHRVSQRCHCR